jgi:ATP-dependent protease ClpP protease subunit
MTPVFETTPFDEPPQQDILFKIFEKEITNYIIHIYINAELSEPSRYIDLIHRIQSSNEDDIIIIHLNLDGGRLDTGIQIINAIRNTPAHVITCLESEAHSMASMIFLSGNEFVVNDNCLILIHNYSGGITGKGNEMQANVEATSRWFRETAKTIYNGFLSEKEIQRLFKGEDFWFHAHEIRQRLAHMSKIRQEKQK